MGDNSKIEWTDATWNPTVGCSILSPGCTNCYAMKMAARLEAMGQPIYKGLTQSSRAGAVWTGTVGLSNWGQIIKPLSWKRPRRIFVNSMSDLFHENIPDEAIDIVFAVMALCPQHTFQVLTKRAERMLQWFAGDRADCVGLAMLTLVDRIPHGHRRLPWPLPNVWLGVSCERQQEADERIPHLLQTPAAVRFISAEPLLGPIDLRPFLYKLYRSNRLVSEDDRPVQPGPVVPLDASQIVPALDWVIVGGESGPKARPMHPDWARDLRDQCVASGVAFFYKQAGEYQLIPAANGDEKWPAPWRGEGRPQYGDIAHMERVGKKAAGRLLDGREWNEMPVTQ